MNKCKGGSNLDCTGQELKYSKDHPKAFRLTLHGRLLNGVLSLRNLIPDTLGQAHFGKF